MKTIITRDGEAIRSSCDPLDIVYDRHNRSVEIIDKFKHKEKFDVVDDRLGWLEIPSTGKSEVLVELTVK